MGDKENTCFRLSKKARVLLRTLAKETGLTMTGTTFATIIVMLIVSYLTQMIVMYEISLILISGLIGDTISTWLFNAPALLSYVNKKKRNIIIKLKCE